MTETEFLDKLEQHKGILLKVSRIYCDHPEDRKDLFQEIICQLWRSLKTFKHKSTFSTWMYRVAINTALVFHKNDKKRLDNHTLSDHDARAKAPYDDKYERQLKQFYGAVKYLNEVEKALILLYIEGLSGEDIAATLGISANNVRVKTNRTKTKLQNIIEAQNNEL
ncbi:RNA polymerase sigma factor [Marinicella gelatinilytica]|uniref:RNA polymerase sigma factor n=1 Tax=Marinicella gelatinilytica TaxID=2996017 RepID=UPI002260FD22|nr:sigma-70 family RNA polymerase sigma factor [Marinicella gelatinilytica]MCX7546186.1 sigma-70 family RNA polymerase sigma factor [Marinicella gelatinilytica]